MTDGLDLATATLVNTHDVKAWPITAQITRLEFRPTGVHIEHTKREGAGCWPSFRPGGWDGDLQYTLWIFINHTGGMAGQWYGSGCIQFWQSCDQNGGPPEEFARNWYYAPDRWAPMTGHQPVPGELVGFMVSAGDARNNGQQTVQERSAIVLMPFPARGTVYVAPVPPGPPTPPVPVPVPVPVPPTPDPEVGALVAILARLVAIEAQLSRGFTNRLVGDVTPKKP